MKNKQISDAKAEKNGVKYRSLSVEEWHGLALDGANIPVTLKLDGGSMRPLIRKQQDSVTVVPVFRPLKKGDIVLFVRIDGAYVIHRVWKIKGETVTTLGDACVDFDAPMSVFQVWGIAVREERNGKTLNLDSALSRAFGVLRMLTRPVRSAWKKVLKFGVRTVRRLEGRK